MEAKRKTAVAATTTVKDISIRGSGESQQNYSTRFKKMQEGFNKFVFCFGFGFVYGMVMLALFYICDGVR